MGKRYSLLLKTIKMVSFVIFFNHSFLKKILLLLLFSQWCLGALFYQPVRVHAQSLSNVQLCNSIDCSLPGSSVHGIFWARLLEWVAISSSWGIFPTQRSNPRLLRLMLWQMDSLPLSLVGNPSEMIVKCSEFFQTNC